MTANAIDSRMAGFLLGLLLMFPLPIDAGKFIRLESNIACLTLYKNELKANGKIDIALYEQAKNLTTLYCAFHVKHLAFKNAIIYHNCNTLWKQIYAPESTTPPATCNQMKDLFYKFSKCDRKELLESIKNLFGDEELDNMFSIPASTRRVICNDEFYNDFNFKNERCAEEIKEKVEKELKEKLNGKRAYELIGQEQRIFIYMKWLMKMEVLFTVITGDENYKYLKNRGKYTGWESPVLIDFLLAANFWKNVDENYNRYGLSEDNSKDEEKVINILRDMEMEKLAYFEIAVMEDHTAYFEETALKSYAKAIRDKEDSGKGFEFKVDWMKLKPSLY